MTAEIGIVPLGDPLIDSLFHFLVEANADSRTESGRRSSWPPLFFHVVTKIIASGY